MKQVTVKELQEKATIYLNGNEALEIEYEGEIVGHYYPRKRTKKEEKKYALEQFDRAVERFLAETNLTEDELAELLDLSKPFPYDTCS